MFKSATGYQHPEDDIKAVALGDNQGSRIVVTPTTTHYPPNPHMVQMWLGNKQKSRFPVSAGRGSNGSDGAGSAQEIAAAARAAIRAAMAVVDAPDPSSTQPPTTEGAN
jgi:hypothetical protein